MSLSVCTHGCEWETICKECFHIGYVCMSVPEPMNVLFVSLYVFVCISVCEYGYVCVSIYVSVYLCVSM